MDIKNHGNLMVPEYVAEQIAPKKFIIAGGSNRIPEAAGCYYALDTKWVPIDNLPEDFVYVPVVEKTGTPRDQIRDLLLSDFNRALLLEEDRGFGIKDRVYRSKTVSYNPDLETIAFNSVFVPPVHISAAVGQLKKELHPR